MPTAEKALLIRNKALAHRSSALDFNDVFDKAEITLGELKSLTEVGLAIANACARAAGVAEQRFLSAEIDRDGRRMFRRLGSEISLPPSFLDQLFAGHE